MSIPALPAPVTAAVVARLLGRLAAALPHERRRTWLRTNHAGDEVTLLEGPVVVLGALAAVGLSGAPGRAPAAVALLVPAALGALDDHADDTATKGLRGHLGALLEGRATTGAVKVAGIGASAVVVAVLEARRRGGPSLRVLPDAVVVAGSANLVNLLDLRPGRALKVTSAAGAVLLAPGASRPVAGAVVGASLGCLPEDLAGRTMLGDCGANALGGLLGLALTRATGAKGAALAALVLTGLTLASERVSFTRVIEDTPLLRRVDAWGRAG